ncbi:uncharacterized bromodomain-containing protein 10 isoform X2 [Hoplias malabaricus]|uniref:uncharacterized bromodomain-containing protein 10 isoform X2 n=1 Tax=Hoplias malabaricus TaxID=27720 RepID=UPI0034618214
MQVHPDASKNDTNCPPEAVKQTSQHRTEMEGVRDDIKHLYFHNHLQDELPPHCQGTPSSRSEQVHVSKGLCNGSSVENAISKCMETEVSEDSRSSLVDDDDVDDDDDDEDEDMTAEVQQAYRIFRSFFMEKHKALTAPFWHLNGSGEQEEKTNMSFKRMDDKFVNREYESITEFVADFRLMLEHCYRSHGVDHWISKQAQKLEIILEQKLTLLSRTLREKTNLVVTSKGRFGTEDEKPSAGTSSRRRSVPRNLATITVGGCESVMVQALRLEEQQKAKEEKRQRELEKKEAEEASAKEVEEWEQNLLALAEPWPISTMWELPAIGHFLCLAQAALNLPEIIFYELERCLLMPRCSSFLAKVMTSLLCQPNRRVTLHRRPTLPYQRWESDLRQKVLLWYQEVGQAEDQVACAEKLGLCHQFFWTLGETSPLEKTSFHLLPFNQRVWLLKGLCDNVYETQKKVQDAVLGQPIHECRESILGYDGQENAYIHFPHFCGADLRIYCQSPRAPLCFPLPPFHIKKLEHEVATKGSSHISVIQEHSKIKEENDGYLDSRVNKDISLQGMDACSEENKPDQNGLRRLLFQQNPERLKEEEPLKVEPRIRLKILEGNQVDYDFMLEENGLKEKSQSTDTLKTETAQEDRVKGPCLKCSKDSDVKPENHSCFSVKAGPDRSGSQFPWQASHLEANVGTIRGEKKKRKKKKEKSVRVKARTDKLRLKNIQQARVAKNTPYKRTTATMKRKAKRKSRKFDAEVIGEKEEEPPQLSLEPTFKLVCTSLEELRDLIIKMEDELDQLESIKKRCGRWYLKKESVKELHLTLIRLLNELLPWEPKLLKAFQKNRARLKKECEDFKKHSEHNNFVREVCVAVGGDGCKKDSSSDIKGESDDEQNFEKDSRRKEFDSHLGNEFLECRIHRPEVTTVVNEFGPLTRSSKRRQSIDLHEDISPCKRGKLAADTIPEPSSGFASKDQDKVGENPVTTKASTRSALLGTCQRHSKPIQALLAKSVGNKVTLMSHPQAAAMAPALQLPKKTVFATVLPTKPTANCQLTAVSAPVTTKTQATCLPNNPVQVLYNMSEGLSLVRNDGTSVKYSVQPVRDQKTQEEKTQQVIILPSNLLVQRTEETRNLQTSVPTSKTTVILSNASGFSVPENKIPVQQVAPLNDTSVVKTPSHSVSAGLQEIASCRASPSLKKTTEPCSVLNRSPTPTSPSRDPIKCDAKQELKTVCIRDSQSILVTTRGGNTGVVKLQTSEPNVASSLPSSPVFTMPPQFQAFLVSKSSNLATSTALAADSTTTSTAKLLPAISPQNDRGATLKCAPKSPLKGINQSPEVERTIGTVILNDDTFIPESNSPNKTAQTLLDVNSLLPAISKNNASVSSAVSPVESQLQSVNLPGIRSSLKRGLASSVAPDPSTFQKVLLVTPTTNIPASTTGVTPASVAAPSVVPASGILIMTQSASGCSTVPIQKETSITATTTSLSMNDMKIRPNLVQTTCSTTTGSLTKVQGINISGLTARVVDEEMVTSKKLAPLTTASSILANSRGLILVQKSKPSTTSHQSLNFKAPVKVTGSCDGKAVTFSTYGTGHMASSALLSAVDQKGALSTVSISNILNNKSEPIVRGSNSNVQSPSLGGPMNINLPSGLITDKPWFTTSLVTTPKPIKNPIMTSVPRFSQTVISSTTAETQISGNPAPGLTSVFRGPVNPTTGQDKVVINTNAPLAPGTQLFINNMRFVVPAQGLGPGSHILCFSNPATHPAGPAMSGTASPVQNRADASSPLLSTSVVQGSKWVASEMQSNCMPVRLPVHTEAKAVTSVPVHHHITAVRPSLISTDSTTFAQVTQLGSVRFITSGQQSLASIARLPSEGKGHSALSKNTLSDPVTAQMQSCFPSMATPALLPPKTHLTSVVSPVISQTIAMPPRSSTLSRIQSLPVATVPPIGGTISNSQVAPIVTVPPSVNSVIMAPCQSLKGVPPGNIRMPVVITNPSQVQSKTSGVHTIHPPTKLLLSPDGAILNVVGCPALQNLPVMTNTLNAQAAVPNCGSVTGTVVDTLDSQRTLLTVNPINRVNL